MLIRIPGERSFLRRTALLSVLGLGLSFASMPGHAAYVLTINQQGANVVAAGSGSLNIADLTPDDVDDPVDGSYMNPAFGIIWTQANATEEYDTFTGFTGPKSFGTGSGASGDSGSGGTVGIYENADPGVLLLPHGYVSGSALSSTTTFDNATFTSLGLTPGVYKWTWGSGATADSFTLDIAATGAAPETSTWMMMIAGFVGLGLMGWRGSRKTIAQTA
jgi:hypothetical protein